MKKQTKKPLETFKKKIKSLKEQKKMMDKIRSLILKLFVCLDPFPGSISNKSDINDRGNSDKEKSKDLI